MVNDMCNIPSKTAMEQALAERVGEDVQRRFSQAVVAVCGLGGLGSHIAFALARAGVGTLVLLDCDRVELTNLNRQQYKASQIGMDKAEALAENLREVNPYLNYLPRTVRVTPDNVGELLRGADVVCEAFDDAEEKSMLVNAVLEQLPGTALAAASGMAGLGSPNLIQTRKIGQRFWLCGDGVSDVACLGSLFAPRVMLCAAHQALVVLRVLAGEEAL